MVVIFDRDTLMNALTPALYTVAGKNTMATIEGVHLVCTEDGKCKIETQDLEKGFRTSIIANVEEEGDVVINANKLLQIMKVMPAGNVKVSVDSNFSTRIESGLSHFDIKALPGDQFPPLPEIIGERGFLISQSMFRRLVNRIYFAIGQNDSRPVFNGAYFKITNDQLLIVACDGNRLAYCEKNVQLENRCHDGMSLNLRFIVPGKTLSDILKMTKDTDETMEIRISRRYIIFHFGAYMFFSKTIDAEYIDYNRILPSTHRVVTYLDAQSLRGALERSSLIVEDRLAGSIRAYVKFTVEGKELLVSTTSANGNVFDTIPITHEDDEGIVIGFNCRFMLDALKVCDDCELKMSYNNPLKGVLIEPQDCEDATYKYFVMPIRMNN
ncbi:MAG: DNA polymerase III subunit beta [Clostridia bacterium]|nr:DNA polymerase III subunit beta [Clostridia bacterium]